jgi:hypothetical protein
MKKQIALLLLTFTFAFPAFAQEGTQAAPESTEAAPVVVVVEPAPVEVPSTSDALNDAIPMIFGMIGMLWGIIATILNYKSIPVAQVTAFLNTVEANSKKTTDTRDDEAVKLAKTLWQTAQDLGLIQAAPAAPATVTTTTTTTSEPLYNPAEADRS